MSNIDHSAEDCNTNPTANTQPNTAFSGSISDGKIPVSGGGEIEDQLHASDKCDAKIHYLSRTIARKHGVIPSAILTGFAYKLKFHRKNKWKDRWWYYDPIEELRTKRWPYLSDGCLFENIEYLSEKSLLIKDCNNKLSIDRTSWYAMDDSVREQALSDLVWFDVAVTRKFQNINPGLIYHNLRYHLREIVEKDPECQIPYHRLNKAMLARMLPMSQSTAKRWVDELAKAKLFLRHPTKRNLYTLADESEYRKIGSSTNAIGSSANAKGSSTNGSSANAIGSSTNANGSTANAIGSSANDNTLYETDKKPLTNQSQKGVCGVGVNFSFDVEVNDAGHKLNQANHLDHKIISDTVGSILPGSKEDTDTDANCGNVSSIYWDKFKSFDQLVEQNKLTEASLHLLDEDTLAYVRKTSNALTAYFVQEYLPKTLIDELWDVTNQTQLVEALQPSFAKDIQEARESEGDELTIDQWRTLIYGPQLETLIRAFSRTEIFSGKRHHSVSGQADNIWSTHRALACKLEAETSLSAEAKYSLFKQAINRNNQVGWSVGKETTFNAVQPVPADLKHIKVLFEKQPHLSVSQVFTVLEACVDVYNTEAIPAGFDKYWASRQGRDLSKLARYLPRIVNELDLFEDCPVGS